MTLSKRILFPVAGVAVGAFASFGYWLWAQTPSTKVDVYDGFESAQLGSLWESSRFAAGAVTMQSQVSRAGRGAARIVLKSRDMFEAGIKGSKDSERAELLEARKLVSREGRLYEFSFSQMLPADFPIVPVRLVLAQWKQYCNGHEPCNDDSPVVGLRYVSGVLSITRQDGRHQVTLWQSAEERRGKWTDYRFQIRFTPSSEGILRAWVDGNQVLNYTGPTAYPENATTGYDNPSVFYFKMGLYRDLMEQPMTLFIDEYRKRLIE